MRTIDHDRGWKAYVSPCTHTDSKGRWCPDCAERAKAAVRAHVENTRVREKREFPPLTRGMNRTERFLFERLLRLRWELWATGKDYPNVYGWRWSVADAAKRYPEVWERFAPRRIVHSIVDGKDGYRLVRWVERYLLPPIILGVSDPRPTWRQAELAGFKEPRDEDDIPLDDLLSHLAHVEQDWHD